MTAPTEFTAGRETHRRPRGYAAWRPQARTRQLLEQVEDVLDEYSAHLPLSVRQIFYRLVATVEYPKDELAYQRLGNLLVNARRARLVPFGSIRDDGVTHREVPWFSGVEGFWDDVSARARRYRRDRQVGQKQYIEVWCEAAGMVPQLAKAVGWLSVPVFSSGGFLSLTAVRVVVDRACSRDVPTVLLHVGDFDPSGEAIFTSMVEDAAAFLAEDRVIHTQQLEAVRVALTAEQVEEYALPTAPAKKSDGRSARWNGETCQLEALPPDALADLVEEGIVSYIDRGRFESQRTIEGADRVQLLLALPEGGAA